MSKKRVKSGAGSANVQRWEQGLMTTPLTEEGKWTVTIGFVVGSQVEDYKHIEALEAAVNAGSRRLFSIIHKKELYAQVNELGNPKNKRTKEVPQFYEICEPCKEYLDSGEPIPLPLLTKLLKFRLLDIKQRDQKRRELESKADQNKDKGGKKGADKKDRSKSAKGSKGGKKTPEPATAKDGSKLKKRGEEDLDNKYIDDEPDDGTSHYVFITGFHEPHLIGQLSDIGIDVDCLIEVKSEDYSVIFPPEQAGDELDPAPEKDEKQIAADEEAMKLVDKQRKELKRFWKDIFLVLEGAPQTSKLQDVACLEYIVKNDVAPKSWQDPDAKAAFGAKLFEDLACLLYDLLDSKRQWKNFLANLKLIHVPVFGQHMPPVGSHESQSAPSVTPAAPTKVEKADKTDKGSKDVPPPEATIQSETESNKQAAEVDMRYYNEMMSSVPTESVSVPLIMHCMLEQIVATEEDREPPSETPRAPRGDGLDENLAKYISSLAFKLALSEEEEQLLASEFEPPKKPEPVPKQPILLNYHDDTSHRLNHLHQVGDFNPMKAELEMLGYLPVANLQHVPRASAHETKERLARLQQLLHFCVTGDTTAAEVDHAFRQFVFEDMNLTETSEDGTVKDISKLEQNDIPWDDPFPYYVGMIPKAEEIQVPEDSGLLDRSESGLGSVLSAGSLHKRRLTNGAKSPEPSEKAGSSSEGQLEGKPPSCPPSPSILKRPGSGMSRKSLSAPSVHFEKDDQGNLVEQPGDEEDRPDEGQLQEVDLMDVVNDVQKRNLDQWCFAEHLEAHIFLQVLHDSVYTHPYIDKYYHKRDNTMLIVLHNPYGENLQRKEEWKCSVHSNVGFRDYLRHVASDIQDWVRDEEAKYQARLLAQEVKRIHREADEASSQAVSVKDKKRERSKSPKKSPSRSGKSGSRSSSTDRPSSSNPFVREGSLKAYKEELDRMKAEEEEREKVKQEKRARSASKKAVKDQADEKDKKRPSSRSSSKSKMSKEEVLPPSEKTEEPKIEEPYFPFTGYDMGTQLLHAKGTVTSMFPADGGQIRTEKYYFEKGVVGVKSVVMKDGHTFMVHILDPKDSEQDEADDTESASVALDGSSVEGQEKAEVEKSEKDDVPHSRTNSSLGGNVEHEVGSKDEEIKPKKPCIGAFGSLSIQLCDGMSLAFSTYGASGEPTDGKKYEPAPYVPPPARSPSPTSKDASSPTKSNKKEKKDRSVAATTPEPVAQQDEVKVEVQEEVKVPQQPFQQLSVSCPDGLRLHYYLASSIGIAPQDSSTPQLLVRQSYPFLTNGLQPTERLRKVARDEQSRVTNSDGTVIRMMKDGTTQVLFADGTVSQYVISSPLIVRSRSASVNKVASVKSEHEPIPVKKDRGRSASKKKEVPVPEVTVDEVMVEPGYWITTTPSGERIATMMDGTKVEVKDALVSKATDPQTRQVMFTREDGTVIVEHPDGTSVVEHGDGTRITTFISDIKVPSEDGKQVDGDQPGTETKRVKLIQVECPGFATLRFDNDTSECSTEFGTGTIINTFPDGTYDVYHSDGGYLQIEADGAAIYNSKPNNDLEIADHNQRLQYIMCHSSDVIVEMIDNQGNLFSVSSHGECAVMSTGGSELVEGQLTSRKASEEADRHQLDDEEEEEEERDQEEDNNQLINTNLKLPIKTKSIVTYKQHAPKFFVVHPDGSATQLLRFQDVSEFIAAAEDDPSTAILMDSLPDYPDVVGITILRPYTKDVSSRWIRDYTQSTIIPPGLTSKHLVPVEVEQIKADGMKFGMTVGRGLAVGSLVKAPSQPPLLRCPASLEVRQLLQYKPVSQELRDRLGSRLRQYADYMKARLREGQILQILDPRSEDEKMLAADLKSQILDVSSMKSGRLSGDVKDLYERATSPPTPSPPPTPQPKRTQADWDADRREIAEEIENRKTLRNHHVPPYFESQLGKSFLLTQAPDMDALSRQLVEDPRQDESRAMRSDSNTPQSEPTPFSSSVPPLEHISRISDRSISTNSLAPGPTGNTPSTLRPGNPTPGNATGQRSPTYARPHNPTPAHATKVVLDRRVDSDETTMELTQSTQVNVIGEPRKEPVRVPAYIRGGRPGETLNTKFLEMEDPVRRKTYTTSIAGATVRGRHLLDQISGFRLLPDYVDFGTLREGNTYHVTVYLKNTGIDSRRFRIKQPPPSTGLKVIYKPGPVAAGMKTELIIEIYAIAVGVEGDRGIGRVTHDLEIISEVNQLMLPISATVLTANEYDNRNLSERYKTRGVRLVNDKGSGPQAVIRPKRFDKNGKVIPVH